MPQQKKQPDGVPAAPLANWMLETNEVTRLFLAANQIPGLINIAGGLPDPSTFLAQEVSEISARMIREHPNQTMGYGPIEGLPALRDCIAARYSRGSLKLTSDNVLVTTSGMQGLDLVGKVLLDPGDLVAGQFPTYLGALDAWRPRQPRYRNMDVHAVDFDAVTEMQGAKFAYVVPNFSNPTGQLVNGSRRQELANGTLETGTWLLEDDPYNTLNYDSPLPPSVIEILAEESQNGTYAGTCLYLGTVSKQLAPGLRLGWVVASKEMITSLTLAKQGSDMCTSGITQLITLEALKSGLIEKLQPQVIDLYRKRRDVLCAAMKEYLADWFDWKTPEGGMFVWAKARNKYLDTDRLLRLAMEEKVCISPSSVFDALGEHRSAIRLNFTLNSEDKLIEAIRRLAQATKRLVAEG